MKFLLLLLIILPLIATADVYKQTDPNGGITYTDNPVGKNAVPVENLNTNIAPASAATSTNAPPNGASETERKPYTTLVMISPVDQDTIQNQPVLTVKINVEPALQEGDKIQIYLDGNPWGSALPTTTLSFTAPERGTHVIYAALIDKNSTVLMKSKANTIYVHQAHVGTFSQSGEVNQLPDRR